MAYDRFLIAPFKTGLQEDLRPFILPEDAFQQLNNAYVFRGRVRKRFGSRYTGVDINTTRLRVNIGSTDGSGNFSVTLGSSAATPADTGAIGQQFTVGTETYTVYQSTGAMKADSSTGSPTGSGTFNTGTGAVAITGSQFLTTAVYFYPSQPVMGLDRYERGPINNQPAMAFDQQNPYQFNGTDWEWLPGSSSTPPYIGTPLFTGGNNDYFWTSNWRGATADDVIFFATNNKDPIACWDGTNWQNLQPVFNSAGDYVITAKIILPFQGYTIMLNTTESVSSSPVTFVNRARWSALGNPFLVNSWLIPVQTYSGSTSIGGGEQDAATQEAIVGAEYIKDRLIVYFEESTWELAFQGNSIRPFIWQKINTELGSVGTFSSIPFDKATLCIGKSGVHACSGANVERIDQKIPDEVFLFKVEGSAYNRIHGIRVFQPELAIWSYVEQNVPPFNNFSNKVMIYNYANETWAFADDCMMCFGYFEQQTDLTWAKATMTWEEAEFSWNSFVEPAQLRQVIFGNQQGFVCVLDPDLERNAANMLVTNVTNSGNVWTFTVINHNLAQDDFIYFENNRYLIFGGEGFYKVYSVSDANTFTIHTDTTGPNTIAFITPSVYLGGLTITRVSRIDIVSKQWNPYLGTGYGVYLAKIVFSVATTSAASIQVDYASDDSPEDFVQDSGPTGTGAIMGTSVLDMYPYVGFDTQGTERLWHPVYFQGQGNCVQIRIYINDAQMITSASALANFELEAILLMTMKSVIKFA